VILVIVNRITKWGYFILYIKEILIKNVVKIYIKEVFLRYKLLKKIILNWDPKFIIVF